MLASPAMCAAKNRPLHDRCQLKHITHNCPSSVVAAHVIHLPINQSPRTKIPLLWTELQYTVTRNTQKPRNFVHQSMGISKNIRELESRISAAADRAGRSPTEVTIIAVTKTVEPVLIKEAFECGIRDFGENRVQEATTKIECLDDLQPPPTWHMVGHLQTNKVQSAVQLFHIVHSVDSLRLAEAISRKAQHDIPVLLQVNVSSETSKSGFSPAEVSSAAQHIADLPHIEVIGLMTIAPLTRDPEDVRPVFRQLGQLRDSLGLKHLSMGMTDDFEVAIEEGATMVRIGRAIFGERKE